MRKCKKMDSMPMDYYAHLHKLAELIEHNADRRQVSFDSLLLVVIEVIKKDFC